MLYQKREIFAKLSIKLGIIFSKAGLSPNQWTLLTIVPILFTLYFLIHSNFVLAALFFIIASFIDLIDGSVARVMGLTSKFGAYLDTIMDRYVEFIIIIGLLFANLPDYYLPISFWLIFYLFGGMMTTYAKSSAKEKEMVSFEIKGGLLERAERLIILFVGILLANFNRIYLTLIIVILAILSNFTALQRIWIGIKSEKK
jgi:phosphatidylglycerophosphate synthase